MIDWINAKLPLIHMPLNGGSVTKVDPDGVVVWTTESRILVEGSYASNVAVRSGGGDGIGRATYLEFSGNPSKFLQGHNVWGSDDVIALMFATYCNLLHSLNLVPTMQDLQAVKTGNYPISMVDINRMFNLPTRSDVLAWIRAAEFSSKSRHGRPLTKGGTIYWGKNSKRWAVKAYSKAEELEVKKRQLPLELSQFPILDWANNKLRIELRLLSNELKDLNINYAKDLSIETVRLLFNEYIGKIEMNNTIRLSTNEFNKLPNNLKSTYLLWRKGEDCREILSRRTYYRHRKDLLEFGINLDLEPNSQLKRQNNVVPLVRVLEACEASVPEWAYEHKLVFTSKSGCAA